MKELIIPEKLPEHVAIIMDGNGRWARNQGEARIFGHQHAVKAVRDTVEAAAELGIRHLSLYTFSTENWNRPREEVDALMHLLVQTINNETETLIRNKIRLLAMGDLGSLPADCHQQLMETIKTTENNRHMNLILALSYSSRWEITRAVKAIAEKVKSGTLDPDSVNQDTISAHLSTSGIPDPALLIRTSGEFRISNFMLWQLAYTELYFTNVLWPDFRKNDFYQAVVDFQKRERRFGMTSEQIQ